MEEVITNPQPAEISISSEEQNENFNLEHEENQNKDLVQVTKTSINKPEVSYEESFIKTIEKENMLNRYLPISKSNLTSLPLEEVSYLKKKSKLELEKANNKENNQYNLNKKEKESIASISLGDCLIKKKSKLELEKEEFQRMIQQQKEEKLKSIILNEENDKVLKIEISPYKNTNEENSNQFIKIDKHLCEICKSEGFVHKGKIFPRCKHYYHNVSEQTYIIYYTEMSFVLKVY